MRLNRFAAATAAAITAVTVAACGSTGLTNSTSPTHAARPAAVTPVASTAQPTQGYYDMSTLEADIQRQVNAKLATEGVDGTLDTVTCFLTGAQTAECHGTYSDGTNEAVSVSISPDGSEYITGNS